MPLSIVGFYKKRAVIILTGGRDSGHGAWMWREIKRLPQRAERGDTGTSLL
jgi:hypothetical protein